MSDPLGRLAQDPPVGVLCRTPGNESGGVKSKGAVLTVIKPRDGAAPFRLAYFLHPVLGEITGFYRFPDSLSQEGMQQQALHLLRSF